MRRAQRVPPIWFRHPAVSNPARREVPMRTAGTPAASAARMQRRRIPAPRAHSGPDPRRTRRRGRGCRADRPTAARRSSPAIAISATATSRPPSETSWQARTAPARIWRANEIAGGALGRQIDRRRRAFLAAGDLAQPKRLAEPALGGADQHDDRATAAARCPRPWPRRPARPGRRSPAWAGSRVPSRLVVERHIAATRPGSPAPRRPPPCRGSRRRTGP